MIQITKKPIKELEEVLLDNVYGFLTDRYLYIKDIDNNNFILFPTDRVNITKLQVIDFMRK